MKTGKTLYRKSRQRQKIYDMIRRGDEHPDAMAIFNELKAELPSLSLGTVYRNLNILMEQGLIRKVSLDGAGDRFDARTESHFHLICEECGSVEDIFLPCLSGIDREASKAKKFKITRHRVDFYGICENCRRGEK